MSCLFRSLASYLPAPGADRLRADICEYLSQNPPLFDDGTSVNDAVQWESGDPGIEHYLSRMRQSSTWGGAIEIKAFCDMYRISVVVHDLRTSPSKTITFHPRQGPPVRTVHLQWTGGHYEPHRR